MKAWLEEAILSGKLGAFDTDLYIYGYHSLIQHFYLIADRDLPIFEGVSDACQERIRSIL